MSYLARLEALDPSRSLLVPARTRLLLLTGQSSFVSSRLQPAQIAFLRAVAPTGCAILERGFPFHPDVDDPDAPDPHLLAASLRNARQVAWCLVSPRFQTVVAAVLQRALDTTAERLLLITGSCGLQIANAAWPRLRRPSALAVRVVALGPACLGRLRLDGADLHVLRADGDLWSRLLYRGGVDGHGPGGHLDYWQSPAMRAQVAGLLARTPPEWAR